LDEQIAQLKIGSADKKDIQTLKYVAEQLGWELDRVAFWFMIAIIFVFDPLAIALILAYNVAVYQKLSSTLIESHPTPDPMTIAEITNSTVEKVIEEPPKKA
jgi:hypothetical protein